MELGRREKLVVLALISAIFTVPVTWQIYFPWLGTKEGSLISLIGKLEDSQPILSAKWLPGLPCKSDSRFPDGCDSTNVRVGRVHIAEVRLTPQTRGSIIVLSGFGPGCFDQALFFKKYPGGKFTRPCSHVSCSYYSVDRSWGKISFDLPVNDDPRMCVKGVVLESGTYEFWKNEL